MGKSVSLPAFAKVNLTLGILGRRPDGYHELHSFVVPLSLHDDVMVSVASAAASSAQCGLAQNTADLHEPSPGCFPPISVETVPDGVDCSMLCPPEKNLAVVAARAFLSRLSPDAPLRRASGIGIRIVKRIPVCGGLGGGSADAAATLRALQTLSGDHGLGDDALRDAAAETGSDVPPLLCGGPVLMEGRGERVSPIRSIRFAPLPVLLANPGIRVSAAEAYAAFDRIPASLGATSRGISPKGLAVPSEAFETPEDYARLLSNDLEEPVTALHPEISETMRQLRKAGAKAVLMAGSGATVFAITATANEAERLSEILPSSYWTRIATIWYNYSHKH